MKLEFLKWALTRSDSLRNAYAARASVVLAANGVILGGLIGLLKAENVQALVAQTGLCILVVVVTLGTVFVVILAVVHSLRASVHSFAKRAKEAVPGEPRTYFDPTETLGLSPAGDHGLRGAFADAFKAPPAPSPKVDQETLCGNLSGHSVRQLQGFVGAELWYDLLIQHQRYDYLGRAIIAAVLAAVLFFVDWVLVAIALALSTSARPALLRVALECLAG